MARKVKDQTLDSRTARLKLKARGKPYWKAVSPGLHLGFRRHAGTDGRWIMRAYLGNQRYAEEAIGVADDYSDSDGTSILDYGQALDAARARKAERAKAAAGKGGPLTVEGAINHYLKFVEGRPSESDVRFRARAWLFPRLGEIEVAALTTSHIRDWHRWLAKQPIRKRTKAGHAPVFGEIADGEAQRKRRVSANRCLAQLKTALNLAWREGLVSCSDEAWRRVEPFKGVAAARESFLSIAESQRLLNAADPDFRLLVRAALETGARYGELCRLRVRDFNSDTGTLSIHLSKSDRPRHVVLTEDGQGFFEQLCAGRPGSDVMLLKADGSTWAKSHQIDRMHEACERAKIDPHVGFHGLRHTWASHAAMNGMPLMVVAKNLGHCDTRMVEKHYGHLAPSYHADAVRKSAPRFGKIESNIKAIR